MTVSPVLGLSGVPLLATLSERTSVSVAQAGSVPPAGQLVPSGPVTALRSRLSPAGGLPTVTR